MEEETVKKQKVNQEEEEEEHFEDLIAIHRNVLKQHRRTIVGPVRHAPPPSSSSSLSSSLKLSVQQQQHHHQLEEKDDDLEMILLQQRWMALRKRRVQLQTEIRNVEFQQCLIPLSEELLSYNKQNSCSIVQNTRSTSMNRESQDDSHTMLRASALKHLSEQKNKQIDMDHKDASNNDEDHDMHHSTDPKIKNQVSLAEQMQSLRKRRRLVGSHRMAGISLMSSRPLFYYYRNFDYDEDDNMLTVRLDVCVEGRFIAKHFLFFDIVTTIIPTTTTTATRGTKDSDADSSTTIMPHHGLYLRLAQHTLPPSVPLSAVLERHFGGLQQQQRQSSQQQQQQHPSTPYNRTTTSMMLELKDEILTDDVLATLRALVGNLHDMCYAHAIRKQGLDSLKPYIMIKNNHKKHNNNNNYSMSDDSTDDRIIVSHVVAPDSLRHLHFQMTIVRKSLYPTTTTTSTIPISTTTPTNPHSKVTLQIKLTYNDEASPLPTDVEIQSAATATTRLKYQERHYKVHLVLIHRYTQLLKSVPLWKFLDEISAAQDK